MLIKTYIYWIMVLLIIIFCSLFQMFLAKKDGVWKGYILPFAYWGYMIPKLWYSYLLANEVRLIPDFYSAATFFFPGVWFLMFYFTSYYHRKYREEDR